MNEKQSLAAFLQESNRIEGYEYDLEDYVECIETSVAVITDAHVFNSVIAANYVLNHSNVKISLEYILRLHTLQMASLLDKKDVGVIRSCNVSVGGYECPMPITIPDRMTQFIANFNDREKDPLRIHADFELIHPFIDGNGRVGRLLWLKDIVSRGEPVPSSFLERFDDPQDFSTRRQRYYDYLAGRR